MHKTILKTFGFESVKDFFNVTFGGGNYPFMTMQYWGTFLTGLLTFWSNWIWNPPGAAFLVIGLTVVNFWYGLQVSRKIKKEGFKFEKAHKTFGVIVSDLIIMCILHWIINFYPYYSLLADALFGYFFTWKLRQIWVHMSLLKLQDGSFAGYFKDYIARVLKDKLGAQMVDNLQLPLPLPKEEKQEEKVTP